MQVRLISAACSLLFLSLGGPAHAVNCYQIWDGSDNLVYQSIFPPFDLARPAFDRAMANVRSQRRTFIFFDTPDCANISTSLAGPAGSASTDPASILDIRSVAPYGRGSGGGSGMLSPTPGSGVAPPPNAPLQVGVGAGSNLRGSTPAPSGGGRTAVFY